MANDKDDIRALAERVTELDEELEISGDILVDGSPLEQAKAQLHHWIDGVTAVVVTPGLGRVTVVHGNGRRSTISSPDLPFAMSPPVGAAPPAAD